MLNFDNNVSDSFKIEDIVPLSDIKGSIKQVFQYLGLGNPLSYTQESESTDEPAAKKQRTTALTDSENFIAPPAPQIQPVDIEGAFKFYKPEHTHAGDKIKKNMQPMPMMHSLLRFSQDYIAVSSKDITPILGRGSYGKVRIGIDRNGQKFSIKTEKGPIERKLHENNILRHVGIPVETIQRNYKLPNGQWAAKTYTKLPYHPGVTLLSFLRKGATTLDKLIVALQCCREVQKIHQQSVIHRDIKTDNFIVNRVDGKLYTNIIDFGLAKHLGKNTTYQDYPIPYANDFTAPEVKLRGVHSYQSDIYSLGWTLRNIFHHHKDTALRRAIASPMCFNNTRASIERTMSTIIGEIKKLTTPESRKNLDTRTQWLLDNHKTLNKQALAKKTAVQKNLPQAYKSTPLNNEITALKCCYEVYKLHQSGRIHCNLNPNAFIVTMAPLTVKLCQLENSKLLDKDKICLNFHMSDTSFASQQVKNNMQYSKASDVYALGVLLKQWFPADLKGIKERMTEKTLIRRIGLKEALEKITCFIVNRLAQAPDTQLDAETISIINTFKPKTYAPYAQTAIGIKPETKEKTSVCKTPKQNTR